MNNLISIIIPTYNRAHLIGETLDSIIAQTYKNWECIIVDDGSTDNTIEVLSKYTESEPRFKFFIRPNDKTKGPNSCRNFGYKKSTGNFIYWFDSDDILIQTALSERLGAFENNVDAVVTNAIFFDSLTKNVLFTNKIISSNTIDDYFTGKITYYVSGPLWRRSFLEQQNELFDPEITYLDDWDFNLRMIYAGAKFKLLDKPLLLYRSHEHSLSQQIHYVSINELKSEIKARNKHVTLLAAKGRISPEIKIYLLTRYKAILRQVLGNPKSVEKYFFLKELVHLEIRFFEIGKLAKTIFGYFFYLIFKKGYRFLK